MATRTFKRERLAVDALIGATAVLCVAGVAVQFMPLPEDSAARVRAALTLVCTVAFAGVAGFSLWVANGAAACAQILAKHHGVEARQSFAFWIALTCAAATGLVSVVGVHLGWMILIDERQALPPIVAIDAAGFALAFVKVAMGFVIEACERIADAEAQQHDALLDMRARRIAELETEVRRLKERQPEAANDAAPQPKSKRASSAAARQMARALESSPQAGAARTPQPIEKVVAAPLPLSEEELRQAVDSLVQREGAKVVSLRSVAREASNMLGRKVPPTQVERHPKRREIVDAAKAA